ncbi:MAG: hypothetical protein LBL24_02420 [Bacteroidales bacterium]|nr:hypothetical protein [Bacteroidales bacterium]
MNNVTVLRVVYFLVLSAFFSIGLMGQQSSEMKTLLSDDAVISAFGSINAGISPFNHTYASYIGGDGALVVNNFFFGGYGSRNIEFHPVYIEGDYYTNKKMGFSQGGVITGISLRSKRLLQYTVSGQLGWGHLSLRDNVDKKILTRDRVNIFTPAFQVKLNLTSFVQLCAGVSYRFLIGVDLPQLDNKDFQGICGSMSIRFGWF